MYLSGGLRHKGDAMFADQYPKNGKGHILFPSDRTLRQDIFIEKVEHPAKNNLHMLSDIVEYLTEPGALVLDPMAGAGSTMYTARLGREIYLIELELAFYELLAKNVLGFTGTINITHGDCRDVIPHITQDSIDLVMFSPPYSNQIKANTGLAVYDDAQRTIAQGIRDFVSSPKNLSVLNNFMFDRQMTKIYQLCFSVLKPGGYIAIIIKDQYRAGVRIEFGLMHMKLMSRAGFIPHEWYQREAIGQLHGRRNLARGIKQVEDEHILMLRKPL
jgi:DNA modification methylase